MESALETFAPVPPFNETKANEEALARHEALCDRVRKCWRDLNSDLIRDISKLSDIGKQIVFEQVLWAVKWCDPDATNKLREARAELNRLDTLAFDQARELEATLRQRDLLKEEYAISGNLPNLWEAIEQAARRYPEWHFVVKESLHAFLVAVGTQSRLGPCLADVLFVLGESADLAVESAVDDVIASRKRGADPVRAIHHALGDIIHPEIPKGFKLSDQAIATLVTVLFETKETMTADAVKMTRNRGCR